MRRTVLDTVGGWDSYNVTEDADLSFRMAALGWSIGYIQPPTLEEAVGHWGGWEAQRRRWMKGYLQTWLVHMQRPLRPRGAVGWARLLTLQITLGASLLAGLFHGLLLAGLCAALMLGIVGGIAPSEWPHVWGVMIYTYTVSMLMGGLGVWRRGERALLWCVPFMPFYWPLLVMPSWLALGELFTRPYHWAKTDHGLTHHRPKRLLPQEDALQLRH